MTRTRWRFKCKTCGANIMRQTEECDLCAEVTIAVENTFKTIDRRPKKRTKTESSNEQG
jgi:predicted ATP-dependent serine protease